jgi:hypothetical protein
MGKISTVLKKRRRPAMRVSRAKFLAFPWFFEELWNRFLSRGERMSRGRSTLDDVSVSTEEEL